MSEKSGFIANIILTVLGLGLGIYFFLNNNKDLSLILFSIALASMLYQFLGGIDSQNTIQMGAIKFGGAAAILIGFMFFFKKVIFVLPEMNPAIEIVGDNWIPVSIETGKVKGITIKSGDNQYTFPDNMDYVRFRKKHEYKLAPKMGNQYALLLKSEPTDTLGYIESDAFMVTGLFNTVSVANDQKRVQVFSLYPDSLAANSTRQNENIVLPFEIKVFGSRFSIEPYIKNEEVVKRTSYVIPYSENESYIVFLEQANSSTDRLKYSKWLVQKVRLILRE